MSPTTTCRKVSFKQMIVVSIVILTTYTICVVSGFLHRVVSPMELIISKKESIVLPDTIASDCACLNDIFDQIFVISIKSRYETLSLTLHQLNEEHVTYTVWEGHSSTNPHSLRLLNQFRHNIDAGNHSRWFAPYWHRSGNKRFNKSTLYYNRNAFFLRQTQVDILKYSARNNLGQILIFEDDILLANSHWIKMFCDVFPPMKRWWIINLGVNQGNPKSRKQYFRSFRNHSDLPMKFYAKTILSYGTFAIAFHDESYEELIELFDYEGDRINCFPMDSYNVFLKKELLKNRVLNIHPTLVLPDVTTSSLRSDMENQKNWIEHHTTDGSLKQTISHFSKYWDLRFESDIRARIARNKSRAAIPGFEELIGNSPSNRFLKKSSETDKQDLKTD